MKKYTYFTYLPNWEKKIFIQFAIGKKTSKNLIPSG